MITDSDKIMTDSPSSS